MQNRSATTTNSRFIGWVGGVLKCSQRLQPAETPGIILKPGNVSLAPSNCVIHNVLFLNVLMLAVQVSVNFIIDSVEVARDAVYYRAEQH